MPILEIKGKKVKRKYQEYDRFIVYNVYRMVDGKNPEFLYRITEHKYKTKYELDKEENDDS